MRLMRVVLPLCALLLLAAGAPAQQQQGNLAWIEFQRPKPGMARQYEEGRKQKAAWHRQRGDKLSLYVWETVMGDDTGTYHVGVLNQTWAELDRPATEESADLAEFNRAIGPTVERITSRLYARRAEVSRSAGGTAPSPYAGIIVFRVRYGRIAEFHSLVKTYFEATGKAGSFPPYEWYDLAWGGETGTVVLLLPRNSWAEFAPPARTTRELLETTLGRDAAELFYRTLGEVVESQSTSVLRFRPDLSYIPAP